MLYIESLQEGTLSRAGGLEHVRVAESHIPTSATAKLTKGGVPPVNQLHCQSDQ